MDKLILSYHDACLYESDLEILKSDTSWLNDRIIGFYFEYISREIFGMNDKILLIGPEVTQAIKMVGNPADVNSIFLDPLNPSEKSFIIFAVNDNSTTNSGGSHWSLAVFSRHDKIFYHFDSVSKLNHSSFKSLTKILKICLQCPDAEICEIPCLQQNNSCDCGLYVLCHTDLVFQTIEKRSPLANIKKIIPQKVHVKRREIIQIFEGLKDADS